jgi:hypothetical protein
VVRGVAEDIVSKHSPLVLGSVDVSEPGLTAAVWDAVLSLVKFVPVSWQFLFKLSEKFFIHMYSDTVIFFSLCYQSSR